MTDNKVDDAFEKWYAEEYGEEGLKKALNHPNLKDGEYVYDETFTKLAVWQSCSQHYEREIERLNNELNRKDISAKNLTDIWQQTGLEQHRQITALKAHVNKLREALEWIDRDYGTIGIHSIVTSALATTEHQSLAEHENEVLERAATVAEDCDFDENPANKIRAMKVKTC